MPFCGRISITVKKMALKMLMIILVALIMSCGSGNAGKSSQEQKIVVADKVEASVLGRNEGNRIIIDKNIDLKGCECKIPAGRTLVFKSGMIKNGILKGDMTKIECKGKAFNRVTIKGSWNVPEISTKLFADLSYENALRDVVALANPKVKNRIVIEKGEYKVKAEQKAKVCIPLCSNTDFILKGTIHLEPNEFKHYYIVQAKGENINIEGKGTIIGDKHTHTGNEGEWGMGIDLKGAINATVSSLTIRDCWGDCIYVGGNSRNVLIEKCKLDHGRRQGISVTKANGVTIRNCTITNVGGTAPEYAIDVEPNRRDSIDNIIIENVTVKDCEGGILVTRPMSKKQENKGIRIGSVNIKNCNIKCNKKYPVRIKGCEKIEINKCRLYAPDGLQPISITYSGEAIVHNNIVSYCYDMLDKATNELRELIGKGKRFPIDIRKTNKQSVKNNKSIARR